MEDLKADTVPQCIHCKDIARPNILMFNDWDWNSKKADIQEARYNKWIKSTRDQKRVIIELGAGTAIATVRHQGEQLAKRNPNTALIRINPRDYQIDENIGYSISLGALDGIRAILDN